MSTQQRVLFFDLARCVAAVAVIAIHVLEPYRHGLGVIPFDQWLTAITVNGMSRWAVPVFILITGALMLSDARAFDLKYYIHRRLGKVLIPFIAWTCFYAWLSGLTSGGYDAAVSIQKLRESLDYGTYYHLGFFYYFIPLYFVIPFLQALVRKHTDGAIYALIGVWLVTTAFYLFRIEGPWNHQLWLYSGYLLLGYVLYQKMPSNQSVIWFFGSLGALGLLVTISSVIELSLANGEYKFGRWLSYKTLNVVLVASMVFMLCRFFGERIKHRSNKAICFISRHSLGIYLLHPIFLWPMKTFGWYQGHPAWVIPLWVLISGIGALVASWMLSRSKITGWLVP